MNHILVWLEMVMQSGIWPSEAKNNICSLANFFFFSRKSDKIKQYWEKRIYFIT